MNMSDQRQRDDSPIDAQLAAPPVSYDDESSGSKAVPDGSTATPFSDLIQSRAAVLTILFLATGALGIPLLWANNKFSNGERIFWTIVVTIYTILLLAAFCWIMMWSYRRIQGL